MGHLGDTPSFPDTTAGLCALREWLEAAGYRVVFRHEGWAECLGEGGEERWVGVGTDDAAALADAVRRMFPSRAARVLVAGRLASGRQAGALAGASGGDVEPGPEPSTATGVEGAWPAPSRAGPAGEAGAAEESAPEMPEVPEVLQATETTETAGTLQPAEGALAPTGPAEATGATEEPVPPSADSTSVPGATGVAPGSAEATEGAEVPGPEGPLPGAAAGVPRGLPAARQRRGRPGLAEALAHLDLVDDRIAQEELELGLATPERQRLVILTWICDARAIEEASGDHGKVKERVAGIARHLSSLAKKWWPGSVRALQQHTTPLEVLEGLGLPATGRPGWEDAAGGARQRLRDVVRRDEEKGRDEYGWADAAFLEPPPTDAQGLLVETCNRVGRLAGPLDAPPPAQVPSRIRRASAEVRADLVEAARKARWLRGVATDFEFLAALFGRLRWAAAHMREGGALLEEVLDPAFRPARPWARELGHDPEARERQRLRRQLLQRAPRRDGPTGGDGPDLLEWLRAALAPDVLDTDRIARKLVEGGYRDAVLALAADTLEDFDRSRRRRLRKVQDRLRGEESLAELEALPPDEPAAPPDTDTGALAGAGQPPGVSGPAPDPVGAIVAAIRGRTEGRRALFVGNRNDPELERTTRETFGFTELEWCEGSPRRVETAAERVLQRTYDFVLCATGFQSHTADARLYQACRQASVPYVRVNRGRRVAAVLAMARVLGLPTGSPSPLAGRRNP